MIVDYSPATGLALLEPVDFKGFKLHLRETAETRPVLPGVRFVDDGNALIGIETVRRLPGAPGTDAWNAGFQKMVDYARSKGWIDDATQSIRAHVER